MLATLLQRGFYFFKAVNISTENISYEISKLVIIATMWLSLRIHVRDNVLAIVATYIEQAQLCIVVWQLPFKK